MNSTQNIPKLVRLLKKGDEASFSQLFHLFGPKLYNTSRKMNLSHEDAEEVVQEVFLKIWKKREQLDYNLSFNAYLLSILKSLVYKRVKKQLREVAFQHYSSQKNDAVANGGEESMIAEDLRAFSGTLLETLPKGQKQIVELRYLHQLSADEIALQLNVSKRTVEHQIYKATKSLRERLQNCSVIPFDLIVIIGLFLT
ncbi:RNA polymerase sigma factor [Pleomorphovibrio marinus]|uniref:RNA polymerase sigma factor n=1 Tax=Pleomorphovibrio marinus TaxID=2164132 RepID=UPI000E0BD925|nr:sigma-70 family RNA polymerase sigma factor [Pleomorphovibrio marinus]